jgi:uncharacterized protein with PIN domain
MSGDRPEVRKGTAECPACGGKLVPIVYGLPGPEASEAAMRGEIALGGCLVTRDDPHLACTKCNEKYWTTKSRRQA